MIYGIISNIFLGLNISTEDMEPCTDQMQCASSTDQMEQTQVTDQVFSPNESYDTNENGGMNIFVDGLIPNQSSVSYGTDLPNNSGFSPPVHQMIPPVVQNNQPSVTSICLDDDDAPPPKVEPTNTNGQAPDVHQYPDDATYYMPSDKDTEVVKAWGQFPQWSKYSTSKKAYSDARRAILEGHDLKSGLEKLKIPPPGQPSAAYLANEQVDFNCFYELGKFII